VLIQMNGKVSGLPTDVPIADARMLAPIAPRDDCRKDEVKPDGGSERCKSPGGKPQRNGVR
jgi:hypothetical protein